MKKTKANDSYHHGDLRSALLEAAIDLIEENGLEGLSLRECARRVGVSHAAPYRHFKDKDALLLAIALQGLEELEARGREAMKGLDDPRERIDAYGVVYMQMAVAHPAHHRVMFGSAISRTEPGQKDFTQTSGAFGLIVETAKELLDEGEDFELAALAFWSLVHGLSTLILDGRIPPEHYDTPEKVEALTRAAYATWRATA